MADDIERVLGDDDALTQVVRASTARPAATLDGTGLRVDPVPVMAMATGALARVSGGLVDGTDTASWSVVVKVVQTPARSPIWAQIPPEFHAVTLEQLRWRTEPELYRSALPELLPPGLRMPAIHRIDEIDDDAMAIWMEDVAHLGGPWTLDDYQRAARLLGRLAGRFTESSPRAPLPVRRADLRFYFLGRVGNAVLPVLEDDAVWTHPLVAPAVDTDLRTDLRALAGTAVEILDALDVPPRMLAHGDACPQNLLRGVDGDIVAIDWQMAGMCTVGFDIGQLIAGHAESGDLDPQQCGPAFAAAVAAYTRGLADEGVVVDAGVVARAAAGTLVIRSAFTALPLELLASDPVPEVVRLFGRRAAYARFLVDLARTHVGAGRPTASGT